MPKPPIVRRRGTPAAGVQPKNAKQKHSEREEMLERAKAAYRADEAQLPEPASIEDGVDEAMVKQFLRLSKQDVEMLNLIASGRPPRNAQAILAAIKMKLEHTVAKPQAPEEGKGREVSVTVKVLGATKETHERREDGDPAAGAPAGGQVRDLQLVRSPNGTVSCEVPDSDPSADS